MFTVKYNSGDYFEGEFQRGYQTGFGKKMYANTNEKYEGMWINGQMTGEGKYFCDTEDKKVLIGQFYNGTMYGLGQIITKKFVYRGMVKNGIFEGYGQLEDFETLSVYEGNFKDGRRQGMGRQFHIKQDYFLSEYEGYWN
jgi:hypothetical protein